MISLWEKIERRRLRNICGELEDAYRDLGVLVWGLQSKGVGTSEESSKMQIQSKIKKIELALTSKGSERDDLSEPLH